MTYTTLLEQTRTMIRESLEALGHPNVEFGVEAARAGFGDASSNAAFLLAKALRTSPPEAARSISGRCRAFGLIGSVQAHPAGYVNVQARWNDMAGAILTECAKPGYGRGEWGAGVRVAVEHTSVNPNKALHIGHVRNVVIGDVVARILKKTGHAVTVLNYVDDLGLQVADIVLGFTRLGFPAEPPAGERFDAYCGDRVYVQASNMCEEDGNLKEERRGILLDMETGNTQAARVAESVTRRVLECQLQTCWNLGVSYDLLNYESHIVRSGLWEDTFEKMKGMGLIRLETKGDNAGCWMMGDKVLVRSNGTATYMAKDMPYAAWKLGLADDPFGYEEYHLEQPGGRKIYHTVLEGGRPMSFSADRVVTVIDSRQADLQDKIASAISRFRPDPGAYVHLGYEAVTLSAATAKRLGADAAKRRQMSGRKGVYVGADRVYETLYAKASQETSKRNPGMDRETLDAVSKSLAVATIRYEMIRQDLGRAIVFDLERSTSLEGDTAPYVLYAHARACRILEKAAKPPDYSSDLSALDKEKEKALLRLLGTYELVVRAASDGLAPKGMARYCHDLAVAFNAFYESGRVIGVDGALGNARLCLVDAFRRVARDALETLGIEAPGRM